MRIKKTVLLVLFSVIILQAQDTLFKLPQNMALLNSDIASAKIKTAFYNSAFNFQFDQPEKKSVGTALLLSLVLPGAGEYYAGNTSQGKIFFGVEVLAWGSFFLNDYHANSLEKDYMAYARQHASVSSGGKEDGQYWVSIGKFDDIYAYNSRRANERRIDELYDETKANFWQWDSRKNRFTYDEKRLKSVDIKSRDIYFYTAILVNHLVSAINAMRLARKYNKSIAVNSFKYNFVVKPSPVQNNYVGIALSQAF
jgi:hypothetical protein